MKPTTYHHPTNGVLYLRSPDGSLVRVNVLVTDFVSPSGNPNECDTFTGRFLSGLTEVKTATEATPLDEA